MGEPARDGARVQAPAPQEGAVPEEGMKAPKSGMAKLQGDQLTQFLEEQQKAQRRSKALEAVVGFQGQYNSIAEEVENLAGFCTEQNVLWSAFGRHAGNAFQDGYRKHALTCAAQDENAADWALFSTVVGGAMVSVLADLSKHMYKRLGETGQIPGSFSTALQLGTGGVSSIAKDGVKEAVKGDQAKKKIGPVRPGAEGDKAQQLAGPAQDQFLDRMDASFVGTSQSLRHAEGMIRRKAQGVFQSTLSGLEAAEGTGGAEEWLKTTMAELQSQVESAKQILTTCKALVKESELGKSPPALDAEAYSARTEEECWWMWLRSLRRSKAMQNMGPGLAEFKKVGGACPFGAGAVEQRLIQLGILGPDGWGWVTTQEDLSEIVGRADAHVPKPYFGE